MNDMTSRTEIQHDASIQGDGDVTSKGSKEYRPVVSTLAVPWADDTGIRITQVECVITAPEGVNLVIVVIRTNVDGLYGLGCATFHQRAFAVKEVVDSYLAPLVVGRDVTDITDIGTALRLDSYWRGGPILNSAISGIDQALWDIAGKRLDAPTWQLLGGRVRSAVPVYVHANGSSPQQLVDEVLRRADEGYRYVRCQVAVPGSVTYGTARVADESTWNPREYLRYIPDALSFVRQAVPSHLEMLHDVHERLDPADAITLLHNLQDVGLYFVEDAFAPEDLGWLKHARLRSNVPLAIGELFTGVNEYLPLVTERLIDFIRCHVSAIGGITPALRLSALAELVGVRTAWHGPRDVSPVGHAANIALDIASPAFGIHEHHEFSPAALEVFPGTLTSADGVVLPSMAPGLGVDIDLRAASRNPPVHATANWHYGRVRRPDGSLQRP